MKRIVKPKEQVSDAEIEKFWSRKFNITQFLFDKQLAFIEDPEPFKVAVCSRRAGKTIACAAHLIHTAINTPGVMCLYITLSMRNAERIVWKDLKKINDDYELGGQPKEGGLVMTFKNGSTIHLCGANNITEIENFRGVPLKLVYIDECQSFREYIKDLIDDIIGPALMDYAGTLCLIGTPGPVPTGFFYECAVTSNVWSKHHWTFWDNPHIATKSGKTHQQLLDREMKRRGATLTTLVFRGSGLANGFSIATALFSIIRRLEQPADLPANHKWNYILGIDVGFKDADALAVLAWTETDHTTYLVDEVITVKQGITELVEQIQILQTKYDFHKMVMDMGGLGKKIGEEMVRRYLLPVEAADKARKMENIELLDDALRTGRFKAKKDSRFTQDTYLVELDRDKTKPDKIVVSSRYHSDIIDSVLYAFKFSPAYAYTKPKAAPVRGSEEWHKAKNDEMFEQALQGFQDAQKQKEEYGDY